MAAFQATTPERHRIVVIWIEDLGDAGQALVWLATLLGRVEQGDRGRGVAYFGGLIHCNHLNEPQRRSDWRPSGHRLDVVEAGGFAWSRLRKRSSRGLKHLAALYR